jgi:hypothetical protein
MTLASRKVHTPVIAKIILLCGFPADSTMVRYIEQQGWTELKHATTIGVAEIKDFFTTRSNGTYDAKPMLVHLRMFKVFLLFYMRKGREFSTSLDEDDVLDITKAEFKAYCGSTDYFADLAAASSAWMSTANPAADTSAWMSTANPAADNSAWMSTANPAAVSSTTMTPANPRNDASATGVVSMMGSIPAQELRQDVSRDKTDCADLNDERKRAVYKAATSSDDQNYPFYGILDGENEVVNVDTKISDIVAQVTNTNCFGTQQGNFYGNSDSNFLPHEEWNKIPEKAPAIKDDSPDDTVLPVYMTVHGSDKSPGDIRQVLARNRPPNNYKSRKRKTNSSVSSTFQVGDVTYYYSVLDLVQRYQRLSPFGGETASASNYFGNKDLFDDGNPIVKRRMVAIEPKDMIGRKFLLDDGDDDQLFRDQVIQVKVKWANGESKREPLDFIAMDDPMTCTEYTKKRGLLNPTERNRFGTEFMEDDVGADKNAKSLSTSQESSYLLMQVSNCLKFCFTLRGTSRATVYLLNMIYLDVSLLINCVHRITVSKFRENSSLHRKCHNF